MEDRNLRPNQIKYGGDDGRTIFVDDRGLKKTRLRWEECEVVYISPRYTTSQTEFARVRALQTPRGGEKIVYVLQRVEGMR